MWRPPPRIPEIQKITEEARISFQFIMQGNSIEDIELQDKILDAILRETGCYKVKRFCEPDMAEFTNMYMQRLGHKHCNFIWVGGYMGSWMQPGTPDFVKKYVPVAIEGFYRDQKSDKLVQCGGDAHDGLRQHDRRRRLFGLSSSSPTIPNDNDSIDACIKHMEDAIDRLPAERHSARQGNALPADRLDGRDESSTTWPGCRSNSCSTSSARSKQAFDPNSLGDRNYPWLPEGWAQSASEDRRRRIHAPESKTSTRKRMSESRNEL